MMKKVLVAAAFAALFFAQGAKAQTNFQTFYDFGGLEFTTGKAFNVMPCLGWKWVF